MLRKDNKAIDSPPTDEESYSFVSEQNDQGLNESISSKPSIPLRILKKQVVELIQHLRTLDSRMSSQITNIILKKPVFNLVQECNSILVNQFEKEFPILKAKYYAKLAKDRINDEHSDDINESNTFRTHD